MSSETKNMAQNTLIQFLRYYGIIPRGIDNATVPLALQEAALDMPEGIPALVAFSERYAKEHSLDKSMVRAFFGRHDLPLVAVACGLIYLSRPVIGPVLSSAWEELSDDMHEFLSGRPLLEHDNVNKSRLQLETKPQSKAEPEPTTVSMTVAELKELNQHADEIETRLDAAKMLQEDLQTQLDHMTAARDNLQTKVGALETENAHLESKMAQQRADQQASDDRQVEKEKWAAETAKALSDAADANDKLSRLQKEMDLMKAKDLSRKMRDEAEQEQREKEMTDLRKAYERVRIQNERLRSDADDHDDTVKEYQDVCEELDSELSKLRREKADLKAENDALKGRQEAPVDQTTHQPALKEEIPNPGTQTEAVVQSEEESAPDAITSQAGAEGQTPGSHSQLDTIEEPEEEDLPEQSDDQANLAAENGDNGEKAQLERLQEALDKLQQDYNTLEESRDFWKDTCTALENQADVQAIQTLRNQLASDRVHNERRISALETQLEVETTSREDTQQVATELQAKHKDLQAKHKELQNKLKEATTTYETLLVTLQNSDNANWSNETANEAKDAEIENLRTECDRLAGDFAQMQERYDALVLGGAGPTDIAAAESVDARQQTEDTLLPRPATLGTTNLDDGAPLRRVQSAPLWLPLSHHGDTFDPLYDVSDYGDDDDDRGDGPEDPDDHSGNDSDSNGPGNDHSDGPSEDDKDDDDSPDDGRNGGADKVAADSGSAEEDDLGDSAGLVEDVPPSESPLNNGLPPVDLPTPAPSPEQVSFVMNPSAIDFVPSVRPKRPLLPIFPHYQAYIASQQGVHSSRSSSVSSSPRLNFRISSVASFGSLSWQESVQGSVSSHFPFPDMYDRLREHTPAPKAVGPVEASNDHVRKLNQDVMKKAWRRASEMPDRDEEIILAPEDEFEIEGMFQRQIIQAYTPILAFLEFPPSVNDIIKAPEMTSARMVREVQSQEGVNDSSSVQNQLSETPRGRAAAREPSAPLSGEDDKKPNINKEASQATEETLRTPASTKSEDSVEVPNDAAPQQSSGPDSTEKPEADQEPENEGGWSDVEDEDRQEDKEEAGAPMLGKYKVTRGPTNGQEDDSMPMLGNQKVTRGPEPTKDTSKKSVVRRVKDTRGKAPASSSLEMPNAGKEFEAAESWSDVEDADNEEDKKKKEKKWAKKDEEGGKDEGEGAATPVLGSHKLGNYAVTRAPTPTKLKSETPKAEKGFENDSQPSWPRSAPIQTQPQQDANILLPVQQSQTPAQAPSTSGPGAAGTSPAVAEAHLNEGPKAEAAHDGRQNSVRRPSNYFPGQGNASKTHDEDVADAFAEYVRKHAKGKLEDSMWADKPARENQAIPQRTSSGLEERVTPLTPAKFGSLRPSNYFPGQENAPKTHDEDVADAFAEYVRKYGKGKLSDSMWADKPAVEKPAGRKGTIPQQKSTGLEERVAPLTRAPPRVPARFGSLAKPQPPPETPTGPRSEASPNPALEQSESGSRISVRLPSPVSCGLDNPNATPRVRLPPRAEAGQAQPAPVVPTTRPPTQGDVDDRRHQAPAQSPRAQEPRAEPMGPATFNGNQNPGSNFRGRGSGRAGSGRGSRGGYQAGRPQQEPAQNSTLNTPRAAPAGPVATKNNDQTPVANRHGGQAGRGTPAFQAKSARAARYNNATNNSFQRWQDRMARAAEEEGKKEQE